MKYTVLLFALFVASVYCAFDFTHHQNGHELFVSLRDETEKIWVIFVENPDKEDDKAKALARDTKSQLKQRLLNEDVYYTEVQLVEQKAEAYKEFTDLIKLELELLKDGPAVVIVYNKQGYWIHGHGIPQETIDTIHSFTAKRDEAANKNQPISFGGQVRHPSAYESFGGGY